MDDLARTALADGTYVAFTDGSCKPNPGPGGCAYRLYRPDGTIEDFSRQSLWTTNNIAEMTAAIDALEATPEGSAALIHVDSQYVSMGFHDWLPNWIAKGWRKSGGKAVENQQLWLRIIALAETREVTFRWIKGHSGDPDNEAVDRSAGEAMEEACRRAKKRLAEEGFE
jgi:ribonuclease HI